MKACGERTKKFINNYLQAGNTCKNAGFWQMIDDAKGTNQARVFGVIRRMSYADFMMTPYWRIVSYQVKLKAGWQCERCGSKKNLEVHHTSYLKHGLELFYIDHLQCLCPECHKKIHSLTKRKVS